MIRLRNTKAMSITELLVSTLLMGVTFAAIGELVVLNTFSTTKITNKTSSLSDTTVVLQRISQDVRLARAFGDYYAASDSRNTFPDTTTDPLYKGYIPVAGWPWQSQPSVAFPYTLGPRCLIIQQPVFFKDPVNDPLSSSYLPGQPQNPKNGFPLMLKKDCIQEDVPSTDIEYLDTVVYQVVPDPTAEGLYQLQMARFSVSESYTELPGGRLSINPPQTVLKGLVGPRDPINPTAPPVVFRYFQSGVTPTLLPVNDGVTASNTPSICGVAIYLEVRKPDTTSNSASPVTSGVHAEAFVRNNTRLTLTNYSP